MLTSSPPMVQTTSASTPPNHGYGVGFSHHRHNHSHHLHNHLEHQQQEAFPPVSSLSQQPHATQIPHTNHAETAHYLSETHSQDSDRDISVKSLADAWSSPSPAPLAQHQYHRKQPILRLSQPIIQEASPLEGLTGDFSNHNSSTGSASPPQAKTLVVRLDLRMLGASLREVQAPRKNGPQRRTRRKPMDTSSAESNQPRIVQSILSANSWSAAKPALGSSTSSISIQPCAPAPAGPIGTAMGSQPTSGEVSVPIVMDDSPLKEDHYSLDIRSARGSDECQDTLSEEDIEHYNDDDDDDDDFVESGTQATKRRSSSKVSQEPSSKKRTRTPDQGTIKKKKLDEGAKKSQRPAVVVTKKDAPISSVKYTLSSADVVSVKGDELALKNPPSPSPPGIFKQLLDNVNRSNPKVFVLPARIQSFFKGVTANSGGDYEEIQEYKPRAKRASSIAPSSTLSPAEEDALQLRDAQGNIRICYHCNKSAVGGRWMISCDHCPLHWHLDCLSPPMASPPPITRKWMCPNHAEHAVPRRRKRKDAVVVRVDDPEAPNDGDIEVIPDPSITAERTSIWNTDTSGVVFKVPERSIKLSFIEKCQRIRAAKVEARLNQLAQAHAHAADFSNWRFDLLVAAMIANEQILATGSLSEGSDRNQDAIQEPELDQLRNEETRDAVLDRLIEPEERQEYLQFRAFQRHVREHGAEGAMRQWLDQQQKDKERIATEWLLKL
ncbi:hypothetical protein BGZ99_007640 [Dissophora globulifera]|uniref:Zinc finger PHD-type domain-containing protein n=1 Tax=Dissophora globulifera TaxID=979702 RepID=A0A9P6RRP8_9FUNG|nr:hypothetical protein BGZ99_007640 [Dissophora globulifera]